MATVSEPGGSGNLQSFRGCKAQWFISTPAAAPLTGGVVPLHLVTARQLGQHSQLGGTVAINSAHVESVKHVAFLRICACATSRRRKRRCLQGCITFVCRAAHLSRCRQHSAASCLVLACRNVVAASTASKRK
eukprot:17350-Heterococcus_DN1.PRE.1